MPTRMTDTAISKAAREVAEAGRRRDLADAGQPGLRLRLTPAGGTTWVLACRDRAGRMRRFPLGAYPKLGIAEARRAARDLHHSVRRDGEDPIAQRRADRAKGEATRQGIGTLSALLDLYEKQRGGALRSWPEYRRSIGRVFGAFLPSPLADVTLADLQLAADSYSAKQQASLAVRCLRPVLRWAGAPGRGYVSADLAQISPPAPTKRRARVLSREELARLLPVLRTSDRPYAAALRFMLLTLARRDEVCSARWADIDRQAGTWTIPANRTKNGQPHVIPLSDQALDLLRARGPDQSEAEALIFATRTNRSLPNWDRETKEIQAASGTTDWHRHDLRRTGATMLGEMGELPDIIEAALNHVSIRSPLAATYNRARYRPQVAAALQRLADALDGIEAGARKVVPLRSMEMSVTQ